MSPKQHITYTSDAHLTNTLCSTILMVKSKKKAVLYTTFLPDLIFQTLLETNMWYI